MSPSNLKCEYLVDPIGIDVLIPRLSWSLDSFSRGQVQTAYQILVGASFSELEENRGSIWDSGKVQSANTLHIPYGGASLTSTQRCYWKVRVWNQDDQEFPYSPPAVWEMGLLAPEEWHGTWIGATVEKEQYRAPLLRRNFTLEGSVKEARLFASGLGYGEFQVNGRPVTDARLEPGFSRYDKRVLYSAYDVTELLKSGPNAIGAILGNGWYDNTTTTWKLNEAPWRSAPKLLLELRVEFYDGTTASVSSDGEWKTTPSATIWNSIYGGETYDARLEIPDWSTAEFDDSSWSPVLAVDAPAGKLSAEMIPPIKVNQVFRPAGLTQPKQGVHVYDMGQNFAGFVELALNAPAGTVVTMKYGERLFPDGTVDRTHIEHLVLKENPVQRFQTDIYICKGGEDIEVWSPKFTYHGFQYVEVTLQTAEEAAELQAGLIEAEAEEAVEEGATEPTIVDTPNGEVLLTDDPAPAEPVGPVLESGVTHIEGLTLNLDTISGMFIHTSVTPVGVFMSSSELLNKIWQNTRYSYLSNLQSIPTDCPHREKNGWTGDAHIAADTGIYNFDAGAIYTKWLNDLQDEQQPAGQLPGIVPSPGWGYEWGNGPAWDSAYAILVWDLYSYYADDRIYDVHYDNLKRYVDYLTTRADETGIIAIGLGDWAKFETDTPLEVTDTGFYYLNVALLAQAAERLGKSEDAVKYAALSDTIKAAYNAKFYDAETGLYANGSQTALSAAVYFGLADDANVPRVVDNLVKAIEARDWHLDVGILGCKFVMNVLSDNGKVDVAYKLATQTTLPSWGHWIEKGATTLYESWDDKDSRNHIMFGDIGAWFFRTLAGIQSAAPGFREIEIKPQIVGDLVHASGIYDSIVGRIVSDWRISEGNLILFIQVPSNVTATVHVPTTDASGITEGGRPLAEVTEIKTLRKGDGSVVLSVPPGRYMFSGPYVK